MYITALDLSFMLHLKAHPELIDTLSLYQLIRIAKYDICVVGGEINKELSLEEHREQLKWWLHSPAFVASEKWYIQYDRDGIPCHNDSNLLSGIN